MEGRGSKLDDDGALPIRWMVNRKHDGDKKHNVMDSEVQVMLRAGLQNSRGGGRRVRRMTRRSLL